MQNVSFEDLEKLKKEIIVIMKQEIENKFKELLKKEFSSAISHFSDDRLA